MPDRWQRRGRSRARDERGGMDIWAPLTYLLAGLLAVVLFVAALPQDRARLNERDVDTQRLAALRELVAEQVVINDAWKSTMNDLCNDPLLQAEELAPDCLSGTITFDDRLFDRLDSTQLTEDGIRKLHIAIDTLLQKLRASDIVWNNLEAIELRGHADPRAKRDPYVTNMRVSQKRPMSLMFYLISDWALPERDRTKLQQLLVLSAASHSRPPRSCPEKTRECYPYWRRVEITPRMKEPTLRKQRLDLIDRLEVLVPDAA